MVNSPSHEEDFDYAGCNADLYASRKGAFQDCSNYERSQQATDPHRFQPLSLDCAIGITSLYGTLINRRRLRSRQP